jgi:Flp pilus assembly protein TadD
MEAQSPAPSSEPSRRDQALAFLEPFRLRVLPSVLRRMAIWKRLDSAAQQEVAADAMQELAVDCLANPDAVLELEERERHTRWIRIVQRVHYALRERTARKHVGEEILEFIETCEGLPLDLPLSANDQRLLERMLGAADRLKNGRMSLRSTARSLGLSPNTLADLRARVVAALGFAGEREQYWRGRLAEALCSTAAAWLRHDGELNLWDDAERRGFEPERCRERFARIRSALALGPTEPEMHQALDLVLATSERSALPLHPRELLRIAERLAPRDATIQLWRFEAAIVDGELGTAAGCLRRARRRGAERERIVLARARLLEARGRLDAATALLERARRRRPSDRRIAASLQAVSAARRYAPSAVSIDAASARSRLG